MARPCLTSRAVPLVLASSVVLVVLLANALPANSQAHPDYGKACALTTLYFEAQRAGKLPANQRVTWRGDSALKDGSDVGADLSKGYYDSGDNVKFGFPMAFTMTMLAWSVVEYSQQLDTLGELGHATDAIRWGTDYLLNAHAYPNTLYVGVGDGDSDHLCWMRPEDMTTDRTTYKVDNTAPGSDVAGETAAALAAASMVFQNSDATYAAQCLSSAKQLFTFADTYRGAYSDSVPSVQSFYPAQNYKDELLWAAAWLYKATGDNTYMAYLLTNGNDFGGSSYSLPKIAWDEKIPAVQTLVSQTLLQSGVGAASAKGPGTVAGYWQMAQNSACMFMRDSPKTPGGLVYIGTWSSLQFVTPMLLNLLVLADSLNGQTLGCASEDLTASDIITFVQGQMDYILGNNPMGVSYMIGFGSKFPQHAHHRAASLPSVSVDPRGNLSCNAGWTWFWGKKNNMNVLSGGIVGGPGSDDSWTDDRSAIHDNEPSTYTAAPLVGVLARLAVGASSSSVNIQSKVASVDSGLSTGVPSAADDLKMFLKQHSTVNETSLGMYSITTANWKRNGKSISRYQVTVVNTQKQPVSGLIVYPSNFHPLKQWNLRQLPHTSGYAIGREQVLLPGQQAVFRYVQAGGPATFQLQGQAQHN